jgi:protein-L-isoaspartate(D-aspartate) O-methyltransferase
VTALEEDAALARTATRTLADVGAANVTVVSGPLTAGWPASAPYDAVLINGMVETVAPALISQLRDGGRLVCVQGRAPIGKGTVYRAIGGHVTAQPVFDATAAPLPGFAKPPEFVF